MQLASQSLTAIIADGLEAAVDGRGLNAEHQRAMTLADAALELLAALKSFEIGALHATHDEQVVCRARRAIAKAEGR